jgi:hypothetical protein
MCNTLPELTAYIRQCNHKAPINDYSSFFDDFREAVTKELGKYYKLSEFKFIGACDGCATFSVTVSGHSCFPENCHIEVFYCYDYEHSVGHLRTHISSENFTLVKDIKTNVELSSKLHDLYAIEFINRTAMLAAEELKHHLCRIPFDKLKETIGVLKVDYNNFMEHEFPVKIFENSNSDRVFQTLSVTRGHFSFGDPSFCAEIYSDKGMQYLADRLSKVLTGKHEEDPDKQFDDDSITDFGLIILKNEMGIVSDEDMDHQDIKPGTICYDRNKRQYVAYLQDVDEEVMVDYQNAYVQILPASANSIRAKAIGTIETTGKVNLIQQY